MAELKKIREIFKLADYFVTELKKIREIFKLADYFAAELKKHGKF